MNIFARHAERVCMAKMLLTPTYHVFRMYVPFQAATFVPMAFDRGA